MVTFGISQMITREHAWSNVSVTEAYMDYIARANHMNLWGHTPLKNVVTSMSLDYTLEDRLELWNQEGWVEEVSGGGTPLQALMNPMGFLYDTVLNFYDDDDRRALVSMGWPANERSGDGIFDTWIEKTDVDYNGADWYDESYTLDTRPSIDILSETMTIRPTLTESSDMDDDDPRFDLLMPGLDWASAPGSVVRHQLVRGNMVRVNLDWTGLSEVHDSDTVYLTAKLDFAGTSFWINRTVSATDTYIEFDLIEITGRKSGLSELGMRQGVPLWMSNSSVATIPAITIWAYRYDPASTTDMVSSIRNLLFADVFYLKMEYDNDYIAHYMQMMSGKESEGNEMKIWMLALGVAMMASAPFTVGTSAIWGLDMITSTLTGKSMFDHIVHGAMNVAGVNENFIGNFSIWNMVSHKGLNMILCEAFAEVVSFGASGIASAARGVRSVTGVASRGIKDIVKIGIKKFFAKAPETLAEQTIRTATSSVRRVLNLVAKGIKSYLDLVGEVIFEMAFDNLLTHDKSERPWGGPKLFLGAMTAMTIVGAMMGSGLGFDVDGKLASGMSGKIRKILPMITLALTSSMMLMRLPVLMANAA